MSDVPGASPSIIICGRQRDWRQQPPVGDHRRPPMDNKTFNPNVLASDALGSLLAFSHRGPDFTNRPADIYPFASPSPAQPMGRPW